MKLLSYWNKHNKGEYRPDWSFCKRFLLQIVILFSIRWICNKIVWVLFAIVGGGDGNRMAINNLLPKAYFFFLQVTNLQTFPTHPLNCCIFFYIYFFLRNFLFSFTSHLPKGKKKSQENNRLKAKREKICCMVDCTSIQSHLFVDARQWKIKLAKNSFTQFPSICLHAFFFHFFVHSLFNYHIALRLWRQFISIQKIKQLFFYFFCRKCLNIIYTHNLYIYRKYEIFYLYRIHSFYVYVAQFLRKKLLSLMRLKLKEKKLNSWKFLILFHGIPFSDFEVFFYSLFFAYPKKKSFSHHIIILWYDIQVV